MSKRRSPRTPRCSRRRDRRTPVYTYLAVALALLAALAQAQVVDLGDEPEPVVDPALPFHVRSVPGTVPTFVLGGNAFTPASLSDFVVGVDPFLNRVREPDAAGLVLVHRVDGIRGYVSLATSPFDEGPQFLLTLQGEPVRSFESEAALLATLNRLARYLIVALESQPRPRYVANGDALPTPARRAPILAR